MQTIILIPGMYMYRIHMHRQLVDMKVQRVMFLIALLELGLKAALVFLENTVE